MPLLSWSWMLTDLPWDLPLPCSLQPAMWSWHILSMIRKWKESHWTLRKGNKHKWILIFGWEFPNFACFVVSAFFSDQGIANFASFTEKKKSCVEVKLSGENQNTIKKKILQHRGKKVQINTVKHRNDWQVLKITEHGLHCSTVIALHHLMAQKNSYFYWRCG